MKKLTILLFILYTYSASAQTDTLLKSRMSPSNSDSSKKEMTLELSASIGFGLIRSTLSPNFDIHLNYVSSKSWGVGINTTSYFLFEKDSTEGYQSFMNTFVNVEYSALGFLSEHKKNWRGAGIGYLLQNQGNYFKRNTFKIYYFYKYKDITLSPELIMTDNFKSIFPGVTIRF